jgi:hypothetical protein
MFFVTFRLVMAATKYFQLLSPGDCIRDCPSGSTKFSMPAVSSLFEEAIHVHLKAALFSQALTLCDVFLTKLGWTDDDDEQEFDATVNSRESAVFKRSRLAHGPHVMDSNSLGFDTDHTVTMKIALYKSEALLQLGKYHEASAFIERFIKKYSVSSWCFMLRRKFYCCVMAKLLLDRQHT